MKKFLSKLDKVNGLSIVHFWLWIHISNDRCLFSTSSTVQSSNSSSTASIGRMKSSDSWLPIANPDMQSLFRWMISQSTVLPLTRYATWYSSDLVNFLGFFPHGTIFIWLRCAVCMRRRIQELRWIIPARVCSIRRGGGAARIPFP